MHRSHPQVNRDRVIQGFPEAFTKQARIDDKLNFDPRVRQACDSGCLLNVGLKICKMIIIGDVSVGKTSIVNRFCKKTFDRDYKATIGVDFEVERFEILDTPYTLQMWDTAGQERFQCIAAAYYRGAHIVAVVFDLTDVKSLGNAKNWITAAGKETPISNSTHVFLVGTKKDLVSDSAYVEIEKEAVKVANELKAEYWSVSSKTNDNIKEFFFRVAALSFEGTMLRELERRQVSTNQIGDGGPIQIKAEVNDNKSKAKSVARCCKL